MAGRLLIAVGALHMRVTMQQASSLICMEGATLPCGFCQHGLTADQCRQRRLVSPIKSCHDHIHQQHSYPLMDTCGELLQAE